MPSGTLGSVGGKSVAVNPVGEAEIRSAYALAGHPGISSVGLIGKAPPNSWKDRISRVADGDGFDVVVGGRHAGAVSVFHGEGDGQAPSLTHASISGLARALLSRVEDGVALVALPGQRSSEGQLVHLPKPVGEVHIDEDVDGVPMGRCASPWAAAAAVSLTQTLAVIDDHRFLGGACLAAAALIVTGASGAVWERPAEYLSACEDFGLVVAEANQPL